LRLSGWAKGLIVWFGWGTMSAFGWVCRHSSMGATALFGEGGKKEAMLQVWLDLGAKMTSAHA
jgi:hypothetical protein